MCREVFLTESNVLNSTEKLLNTIRGGPPPSPEKSSPPVHYPQQETSIKTNIKHSLTVGVFIEGQFVSLALTGEKKAGAGRELIKWSHLEIPDFLEITHARFPAFLKSALTEFLGKYQKADIWTAIDSKDLKLRNLNIPDLSDAKVPNAALWGLKKEVELDAEKEIFDFEYIDDVLVNGIQKKNIVAFTGDKKQVHFLKHLFSSIGYPLAGITAMPFALQNFIRANTLKPGEAPLIIVNVARQYSEITCLSGTCILLTRNIRTGSYSLVEELLESGDKAVKHIDITGILSSGILRDSAEFNLIEPAAARLMGKIVRTGDYCSLNFAANEPISKFLFFGEADNCNAFMAYAAEQLSSRVELFSPLGDQAIPLGIRMPLDAKQRTGIIPALGIALSENEYTPNFLYTYLQRNIKAKYRKMNWAVAAAGLAGLVVCTGAWGWMNTLKNKEIHEKTAIEKQLTQYNPLVNQSLLTEKITEARKKSELINRYARDYLSLAVINEICSLTPRKISITSLESDFTKNEPEADKASAEKKGGPEKAEKKRSVTLKGIVTSEFTDLESTLTGYVITLGDSPLFGDIRLKDKQIEKNSDSTVLKFTAEMEIF